MEPSQHRPAGWVKIGEQSWETATFAVASGSLEIRRQYGGTTWIPMVQITSIDETAAPDGDWAQVELQLADTNTIGAKLLSTQLTELVVEVARAHQPASAQVPAADSASTASRTDSGSGVVFHSARNHRWATLAIGVVVALLLGGAGCGAWRMLGNRTYAIQGLYTLMDTDGVDGPIDDCEGDGGYSDFGPGGDVKVRDAEGKLIGSGVLRAADDRDALIERFLAMDDSFEDAAEVESLLDMADGYLCPLVFTVEVPRSDVYEIEKGSGRRGTFTYSFEEMEDNGWHVSTSLGG